MIIAKNLKCTCCGEKGTMREFVKIGDELKLLKGNETSKTNYRRFVCSKCSHVDFYWSCVETTLQKEVQVQLYEKFVLDINKRVSDEFLDIATKMRSRFKVIYDRELKTAKPSTNLDKASSNQELCLKQLKAKLDLLDKSIAELKDVMIYIGPFSVVNDELKLRGTKGIENVMLKSILGSVSLEYDDELKAICDYLLSFKETGALELARINAEKRYKASGYKFELEDSFYRLMNFKFVYKVANEKKKYLGLITFKKADDYYLNNFDKKYFDELRENLNEIEIPNI